MEPELVALLPTDLTKPLDRLYVAAGEWLEVVHQFRASPELQGTWADMLLRTLLAHPAVSQVEYARRAYAEARGWTTK